MFASKNVQIHRRVRETSGSCLPTECAYNECNQQRSLNLGGPVGTLKGLSLVPTSSYQYFPRSFLFSCIKLSSNISCSPLQIPIMLFPTWPQPFLSSRSFRCPHPHPQPRGGSLTPLLTPGTHSSFQFSFCCFGPALTPQRGLKFSHLCFQGSVLGSKKDVGNKN